MKLLSCLLSASVYASETTETFESFTPEKVNFSEDNNGSRETLEELINLLRYKKTNTISQPEPNELSGVPVEEFDFSSKKACESNACVWHEHEYCFAPSGNFECCSAMGMILFNNQCMTQECKNHRLGGSYASCCESTGAVMGAPVCEWTPETCVRSGRHMDYSKKPPRCRK